MTFPEMIKVEPRTCEQCGQRLFFSFTKCSCAKIEWKWEDMEEARWNPGYTTDPRHFASEMAERAHRYEGAHELEDWSRVMLIKDASGETLRFEVHAEITVDFYAVPDKKHNTSKRRLDG